MANSTAIGAIHVEASIGTAEYVAGARKIRTETAALEKDVKTRFTGLGAAVKGGIAGLVGALSIGAFVQIGRAALQYASSLGEVSQQLGVTTRDLQTFRYAAGQLGVSQSELDKGLENLTKTLGKVAVGAEKPAKALEAIGLNAQQVARMDTGDAFRAIADALEKVTDRAQRAAVETALFGESGARLDTMLSGGSAALNELAAAADELGIVLSDEQIQKADETADKLEAMKTVLSAQIAGVVADNADAIMTLANAFAAVAGAATRAIGALVAAGNAISNIPRPPDWVLAAVQGLPGPFGLLAGMLRGGGGSTGGQSRPAAAPAVARPRGIDVGDFLAKAPRSGGGRRARTPRAPRDDSARDLFRFEQDELRAQMDILRAKQQLSHDYVDRTTLGIQILDLERQSYANDLKFQVSQKDLTQVQADRLLLLYNQKDALERQKLLEDEQEQRRNDTLRLDTVSLDIKEGELQDQEELAETASERRAIELRMLEIARQREQLAINDLAASKDEADREEARRRQVALNANYSAQRAGVIASTRGPMEDYLASLPTTAAKAQEALERLQVQGFEGLIDSVLALSDGFKSAKEQLLQTLKDFFLGLARMELQKGLGSLLQSTGGLGGLIKGAFNGGIGAGTTAGTGSINVYNPNLPGFATGGSFRVGGFGGVDRNLLMLNGLPIARVSYGERVSVSNDNGRNTWRGERGPVTMYVNTPDADSFRRSNRQIARELRRTIG